MAGAKVVITGAGLVSPLGLTREETFDAVLQARCGIGRLTAIECELPAGRDGGEGPPLPDDYEPALPREARYLRKAINDAMVDTGMSGTSRYAPERCGLMIGTTLHGMRAAGQFLRSNDYSHLGRFLATHVTRAAAGDLGLTGFSATTCSACSSSLGSIALGVTMLESGEFDLVIAGGYDPVSEYAYAGFNSLRLVAEGPLRPFARGRVGMKLSEGYGIVVLERLEDAHKRGARVIAQVAGFGESADAHHLTQPHPQGEGASRAMRQAIASAGLGIEGIDLLVAHATGTPDNDASEFAAMKGVFGERLARIPCVAFKSHLGHTLGGAGAVELILSAMALERQVVPPCANVAGEEVEFAGLDLVTGAARKCVIRATLNTSLGFGGANTCVVLTRPSESPRFVVAASAAMDTPIIADTSLAAEAATTNDVVITGIGVVLPGAIGTEQFLQLLSAAEPAILKSTTTIADEQIAHLVNARRVRRMSDYVKLMLAATTLALQDALVSDVPAFANECSAILGTTHGSCGYSEQYYRQIIQEGVLAANPMLFAEGVPNAASAHVSLMLGMRGACQTLIGSRTVGLDALALASRRIRSGRWDRAIVGAAEEWSALTHAAYATCGLSRETPGGLPFDGQGGFVSAAGSVVMVLERRKAAMARGARVRGMVHEVATRVVGGERRASADNAACAATTCVEAIGCPGAMITSANATWVDAFETTGIAGACGKHACGPATVTSMYGHIGETFSVMPLAGIAAALLSGRLPRLWDNGAAASDGSKAANVFGVICSDFTGIVSGARIERLGGEA